MKNRVLSVIEKRLGKKVVLEKPKDKKFGHYATPVAFSMAKELRKPPFEIAKELCEKLKSEEIFAEVEPLKGYINFRLSEDFLDSYATAVLKNPERIISPIGNEKILLEFVSANPTGPLHIGHARGAVIGDALYRMGKALGYEIKREYYINDHGSQVYKLGLSIYLAGRESMGHEVTWPEGCYRGEYVYDLARDAMETLGRDHFVDESSVSRLAEWGKDRMMELIVRDLEKVGIYFDSFVSEKSLYDMWPKVRTVLEEREALYEKDSKIWLRSTRFGDEKDRVVVREDGRPTYLAGDIIYHYQKFKRSFDRYINIWGADHHGYIARVKAAIEFLGFDSSKLEIVLAQMVSLLKGSEPFKMSKRAGNYILMSDVVEEIGKDALRFMFLSKKSDTHLEFDVETLKQQDASNPVYYINYAHARVYSLFEKAGAEFGDVIEVELKNMNEEAKDLLFSALLLPEVVEEAFLKREANRVTDYLKALAAQFHRFYNENRVLGSQKERELMKLFATVAVSINKGLELLGIEAKKRM